MLSLFIGYKNGGLFVRLNGLSDQRQEQLLGALTDERDPLSIILEIEDQAIELGYKDVHEFITDNKPTEI